MRTLYFDESGFTGYNLLDPQQPIFVLASTDIVPAEAETILKESFPDYRGEEFKFSNIWGSRNQRGLTELARRLARRKTQIFAWMIDKKFAALTKMVDFLIEPYITDAGYDFYSDGFCWKYTNYIYFGLTQFAPADLYETLVREYQAFSRAPSEESLRHLQERLSLMASSVEGPAQIFVEQMELGAQLFARFHDLDTFRTSNELQLTSMLSSVIHWRQRWPDDFAIVHDASSNFFRQRELWATVTGGDAPSGTHTIGDGTTVEFPLRVISTTPIDSKLSYSIQLCDILAGFTTRRFDNRLQPNAEAAINEASEAGLGTITYNGIRASTVFPDSIPPKPLVGPDAVDRFREVLR